MKKFNIPMLTNSAGKSSSSFTFAFIAFNLISLWLLLSIVCPIFSITTIPAFSGTDAMAYLTPIFLNYFGNKYITESNKEKEETKE